MADIVSSLFGVSVPSADEAEMLSRKQNYDFGSLIGQAQINPWGDPRANEQFINQQAAQAALGGAAVRGLAGLFGVQDKNLKRVTDLESILQETQQELGYNANNPALLYPTLQQKLADAGFGKEAFQVGQIGQKAIQDVVTNQATLAAKQAELAKARREANPLLDAWKTLAGKSTPESVTKSINDNYNIDKLVLTKSSSEEDVMSTDRKISLLSDIYNDETKSIAERNRAAKQFNQLTASKYQGTGSIPQLSLLEGDITTPNLTFQTIEGSKAETVKLEAEKKAVNAAANRLASASDVNETIDNAISLATPKTTGAAGKALALLPQTDAYKLAGTLDTIKANIGFDKLQAMRDASPTGGALGQVAVQEINYLQATIAKIEQGLSDKDLKTNLIKVKESYNRLQKELFKTLPKTVENLKFDPNLAKLRGKERDAYITKIYQQDKEFQQLPEDEQIQTLNQIAHLNEKNKATIGGKVYTRPYDFTDAEWDEYINYTKQQKGIK